MYKSVRRVRDVTQMTLTCSERSHIMENWYYKSLLTSCKFTIMKTFCLILWFASLLRGCAIEKKSFKTASAKFWNLTPLISQREAVASKASDQHPNAGFWFLPLKAILCLFVPVSVGGATELHQQQEDSKMSLRQSTWCSLETWEGFSCWFCFVFEVWGLKSGIKNQNLKTGLVWDLWDTTGKKRNVICNRNKNLYMKD